jgi:hypothetical protein
MRKLLVAAIVAVILVLALSLGTGAEVAVPCCP